MGVSPDILYDLSQLRAQELQQEAARGRLVTKHSQGWIKEWRQRLSAINPSLAKVVRLLSDQVEKPIEGCC